MPSWWWAIAWHDLMLPSDGADADGPFPDLAMDKPPTFPSFKTQCQIL